MGRFVDYVDDFCYRYCFKKGELCKKAGVCRTNLFYWKYHKPDRSTMLRLRLLMIKYQHQAFKRRIRNSIDKPIVLPYNMFTALGEQNYAETLSHLFK